MMNKTTELIKKNARELGVSDFVLSDVKRENLPILVYILGVAKYKRSRRLFFTEESLVIASGTKMTKYNEHHTDLIENFILDNYSISNGLDNKDDKSTVRPLFNKLEFNKDSRELEVVLNKKSDELLSLVYDSDLSGVTELDFEVLNKLEQTSSKKIYNIIMGAKLRGERKVVFTLEDFRTLFETKNNKHYTDRKFCNKTFKSGIKELNEALNGTFVVTHDIREKGRIQDEINLKFKRG